MTLTPITAVADSMARAVTAGRRTPGISVAVARHGSIVFARGYGDANVELRVPAGPETVYCIASVTKQFTAAAALRLIDEGRMSLEEPMTTFLPEYPTQGHRVTVRHLLDHTSGIKSFTEVTPGKPLKRELRPDLTYAEMVELFGNRPFDFAPGEKYRYGNGGYYLLAEIIGRVSGVPYREYVEREMLQPLGLHGIVFGDDRRLIPDRVAEYEYDYEKGQLGNAPFWPLVKFSPSTGGLWSAVGDLLRWSELLHGGRVLSTDSLRQMTTPTRLADGSVTGYGLGVHVGELGGHRRIWHGGGRPGATAFLSHYPEGGVAIAVLANTMVVRPRAPEIEAALARVVLGIEAHEPAGTEDARARSEGDRES